MAMKQRAVRFYELDKNGIEVGENRKVVCKRFLDSAMTMEQVAEAKNRNGMIFGKPVAIICGMD